MRILIVSDVPGNMRGGVPEETRQLVHGLRARGHTVAFCGDIAVTGSDAARHLPFSNASRARIQQHVREALKTFEPELVHLIGMSSIGVHALRHVLREHPWVLTCHSIPPYERKLLALHASETAHYAVRNLRFFAHALAWRFLLGGRFVPHAITHSEWVGNIVSRYGQPHARTSMIALGWGLRSDSDPVSVRPPTCSGPRVITIGGMAHTKGHHDAITAVALLRADHPDLTYQIIGEVRDTGYLAHLHALIRRLGLEGCVHIRPNLDDDEKQEAMRSADLYLQASHEEGFCLAYIEAASRVARLVGTDTGAIGRISAGDAGMQVVPPRNPDRLAAAARALLRQSLPEDMMTLRLERLERLFSWQGYLDRHEQLYVSLAKAHALRARPETAAPVSVV